MYKYRSAATMAAVAFGALLAASPVAAQSSDIVKTKGLMFGLHLNGTSLSVDDDVDTETMSSSKNHRESGAGGGAQIGWGFTKWFMLYGGVDAAKMEIKGFTGVDDDEISADYTLIHGDIGARFSFPSPNHGFVPYANAALTTRIATAEILDEDVTASGNGFTVGAGFMYFFNPKFALDLNLQVSRAKFSEFEAGGVKIDLDELGVDVDYTNSARVNIGVKFFPHFGKK